MSATDNTKFDFNLKYNLRDELKTFTLVDDSLLLQTISPALDIFDMYSDFSGEPIGIVEYFVPHPHGRNLPVGILYGVPKLKWGGFEKYINELLINHEGKQYGPFLIKGKTKDINKQGNKYPIHELIPIYLISVINFTDSKILNPSQDSLDGEVSFKWENYKRSDDGKQRRRTPISKQKRFEIYQRDDFRCYYCKRHKDEFPSRVHLTLDHKIPYSDGGDDSFENLVTACSECNKGKSNKIFNNL